MAVVNCTNVIPEGTATSAELQQRWPARGWVAGASAVTNMRVPGAHQPLLRKEASLRS